MLVCFCKIPVTIDEGRIRIVAAEDAVADTAYPYISVVLFPCLYLLCTCDDGTERLCAAVGNPCILSPGMHRIDIFPVNSRCHEYLVTRHSNFCCIIDVAERHGSRTVAIASCIRIDIDLHA